MTKKIPKLSAKLERPPLHTGCDCSVTYTDLEITGYSMMKDGTTEPEGTFKGYELLVGKKCQTGNCDCRRLAGHAVKDRA